MQIVIAAFLPPLIFLGATWWFSREPELRRASLWFAGVALLWFAPCWLAGAPPVAFDFLTQVPPWQYLRPEGYLDRNPLLNDVPLQFLPWREAVASAYASFELPLLNRASSGGSPLWENLQAAVVFPLTPLATLFSPGADALFLAVSKVVLALFGMYLFLQSLGLSWNARLFGAFAYGLGGFTVTFLLFPHTNVTTLLPLFCHALVLMARQRSPRSLAWAAAVLGLMFFGGHPESVFHSAFVALPFAALLIVRVAGGERLSLALRYLAVGFLALALAAPLLLPFLHWLPHTERMAAIQVKPEMTSSTPFAAETFIPFAIPNYFGNPRVHNYRHNYNFNDMASQYAGLASLILALALAVVAPLRHRFWLLLLAGMVILAIPPPWLEAILNRLPLFELSAKPQTRLAVLFTLAVAGAHGLDLLERSRSRRFTAVALLVAVSVAVLAMVKYPLFAEFGIRRLIFFTLLAPLLSATAIALAPIPRWHRLTALLPPLLLIDLFGVLGLYNPAVSGRLAYPSTPAIELMKASAPPYRVTGIDRALPPNSSVMLGLEEIRPHDPVAFDPYIDFLRAGGLDTSTYFARFHDMPHQRLLDFLGVRFVIADPEMPGTARYRGADAAVFENAGALPRYFVPSETVATGDPVTAFYQNDDARRIFGPKLASSIPAAAEVRIVRYGLSSTVLDVTALGESFLASSEPALPGWRLRRNGEPWPLETINGVFIGWQVPPGRSLYALSYRPPLLLPGTLLAFLALVILAFLARSETHQQGARIS